MQIATGEFVKGDVLTYYEHSVWKNKVEGNDYVSTTHGTRDDAVVAGRQMAMDRHSEHIILTMDGSIDARNNYSKLLRRAGN